MSNVITLNDQGVCVGVKQVKDGYILQGNEIFSESYDVSIIGKTYDSGSETFSYTQSQIEADAIRWRDGELIRTDTLMLLSDYPFKEQMTAYRQALRDWPATAEFPDTKPVFN